MKTIKSAAAIATAMALGGLSTAANANLIITEYIEGNSNNKAVEISNVGSSPINLDAADYKLRRYNNGKGKVGATETLTGTLAAGQSIVFHNAGAADKFKKGKASTITYFNGDDTLVLTKDDVTIDRFGKIDQDPGSAWTDPNNPDFSSANKTLRRKASVTTGDTDAKAAFPTGDQWAVFDVDTADGLGCVGVAACSSTASPGILLITEYIEGGGSNKAVEISNVGGSAIDLGANEYKLTLFGNGSTEARPDRTETLTGTLAAGASLVFHNSRATDDFKKGKASTVTYFNGDDALVLTKDGNVIDSIGKVGERKKWKDGDFSTEDKTLRRKASVKTGDTNQSDDYPGATKDQWLVLPKDTADGLGCAGENACSDSNPTPPQPPAEETGPCNNCAEITAVKNPATFNGDIYYNTVLTGNFENPEALKNALSTIIEKDHVQLTYSQVWTVLTHADQDTSNDKNVIQLYTGASVAKNSNPNGWNREHVWSSSHGFPSQSQWAYTDAHHLRPSKPNVNSTRSNYDFGECGNDGIDQADKGAAGNCLDTAKGVWEPRDEVKGDVARMMFYMDTRYQGQSNTGTKDLKLVNRVSTSDEKSNKEPVFGILCDLYAWHKQDAVDAFEQNRNNEVYRYQGNRNPFIDRPELVEQVYGEACREPLKVEGEILAPESVNEGSAYTIDASAIKAGESDTLTYKWELLVGEEKTVVGEEAILSLTAPKVNADQTMNFKLTVSNGTLETTKSVSLKVMNVPLTLEVTFDGNTKLNEGDKTSITATVKDAPQGATYAWKQVAGISATFTATALKLDVTSPQVSIDQTLVFELTTTVNGESFSKPVSIEVKNTEEAGWVKPDGAGSLGGFMALLLPLIWLRRRQS
ncbi:MAG: endonuclease [Parashewanella sp.]